MDELRTKVEAAIGRPLDRLLAEMKDVADWIERTKPQGLLYDSALPSLREAGTALDAILNLIGGDGWKPIETAPREEDVIVRTAGGSVFGAALVYGVEDEEGSAWAWTVSDGEPHPPCWSDGVCWSENEDSEPSDPPVGWMPLPPFPEPTP
ncbi:hypothetical protein [Phenylobacterium sp.]|uniref:hypothetical protein n=1 Tax=Phenylobacterium sp. TaxID=1871053 RepID=UPI0026170B3F|nr:hypothetical protein [Phenylobacterium sp.]